jgi:hypothetical protein
MDWLPETRSDGCRTIESVDSEPAPLRMVPGSQAPAGAFASLRKRIADFETLAALAASTNFPPGA